MVQLLVNSPRTLFIADERPLILQPSEGVIDISIHQMFIFDECCSLP